MVYWMNREKVMKIGVSIFICFTVIGILYVFHIGNHSEKEAVNGTENQQDGVLEAGNKNMYEYDAVEIWCENEEQRIYGICYEPETDEKVPLVIFAHELCSTHASGIDYAMELASRGVAAYTLDFRGGSSHNRSDGKTTEMSVMTEADDLRAVVVAAKQWDFVDSDKIVVIGASQGGAAASMYAAENEGEIAGLVLLYPAFVISDEIHGQFASFDEVPDEFSFLGWIRVGRNYVSDIWDYDFYEEMEKYDKPVLILHGNRDYTVGMSYAKQAEQSFPDAELCVLKGAGHGFYGKSFEEAMEHIFLYLQEIGVLEKT